MKKETRGRKAKTYERTNLRIPVELRAKFKREILEFELKLESQPIKTKENKMKLTLEQKYKIINDAPMGSKTAVIWGGDFSKVTYHSEGVLSVRNIDGMFLLSDLRIEIEQEENDSMIDAGVSIG